MEKCPNCSSEIKSTIISKNELFGTNTTGIINLYTDNPKTGYCNKCGESLFKQANQKRIEEKHRLTEEIIHNLDIIPAISTHSPINWDYEVRDVVTAQATMGTGAITEITSTWTDFWGGESKRHSAKIKQGEQSCFNQIKKQALDLGGNAIIGLDIDYAEVGGVKAMLLVCMTGTVVWLNNFEILGENRWNNLISLQNKHKRMIEITKFKVSGI